MSDFFVRLNDRTINIKIIDEFNAEIDGARVNYEFKQIDEKNALLKLNDKFYESTFLSNTNGDVSLLVNGNQTFVNIKSSLEEKSFQLLSLSKINENNSIMVKSPMPGLVLKIKKQKGDSVVKGETIVILEAMKMENEIKSPSNGILDEIFVKEGKAIEKNILLFAVK